MPACAARRSAARAPAASRGGGLTGLPPPRWAAADGTDRARVSPPPHPGGEAQRGQTPAGTRGLAEAAGAGSCHRQAPVTAGAAGSGACVCVCSVPTCRRARRRVQGFPACGGSRGRNLRAKPGRPGLL